MLKHPDVFTHRHNGPRPSEISEMLAALGLSDLSDVADRAVPDSIRTDRPVEFGRALSEGELLEFARKLSEENLEFRSFIGMGYYGTVTPPVILRNVLENPGWYTAYTPYQAEISQGRLEALLNFQTVVVDLTGLPIANASLLDEATAAAEAMGMFFSQHREKRTRFLVADNCHPQTIAVVKGRAVPFGIDVEVASPDEFVFDEDVFGALIQYPATDGVIADFGDLVTQAHEAGAYVAVATDLLALTLLESPGTWGADCAIGSSQRFGVSMGYGGPHAGFISTSEEFKRRIPGRIIGVSVDADGKQALRMALQTREQHIRREKATSNICTAQVLLANIAAFYAVYHGPNGLTAIANRVHAYTGALADGLARFGHSLVHDAWFDTLRIQLREGMEAADLISRARAEFHINLRQFDDDTIGISLDETVSEDDLNDLLMLFAGSTSAGVSGEELLAERPGEYSGIMSRTTDFLTHPNFNTYHSETELLRYLKRLENKDISLTNSMIALGSCTMKLNATAEMMPITMPGFANIHPYVPEDQALGYRKMINDFADILKEITGFAAVSFQPNSGAQGEYTGLLTIRARHEANGEGHRNVCLIPASAHGTNPASAVMAGMKVVVVKSDENGNVDMQDMKEKVAAHADNIAAFMITYPSTHGVFEPTIREMADLIHDAGGLVYMDGANLNAQVGLCRPAEFGMDVCHLNLHKTFAIPHGGGGPGMGPICVTEELAPFLPGHPLVSMGGEQAIESVAAAPFGSASIIAISWAYCRLMGGNGLHQATLLAILNANYMAKRLEDAYQVLFRGPAGFAAHEFIIDLRPFQKSGIQAEDVAKRLMDFGFHAPTMSFPVSGTLMIEPTESESKAELDRFCDAMLVIREEIAEVERGEIDAQDNPLKNAPHTAENVTVDTWDHPYSRHKAAFPLDWVFEGKYWPPVSRVDNAYGDRNLVCSCPPIEDYA